MILKSLVSFCKNCLDNIKVNKNNEIVTTNESKKSLEIDIRKPTYEYAHGKKFKSAPKWIVIHYTACANISARSMCRVMRNNTSASSHFYIDENDICQAVPLEYIAWHVCDGKCKQPNAYCKKSLEELSNLVAKDWRYDLAAKSHLEWINNGCDFNGNNISLSVDLCVKKKDTSTLKATDKDWYFEQDTVDNAAKLVAYLANVYNIDDSHIITHCMATGKLCPQPFVWPPEVGDKEWESFKTKVNEYRIYGIIAKLV